jgi:hypothetical protein
MEWLEGDMSLKNPVTPLGIDPGTIQLVAQHLNHYATPKPLWHSISLDETVGTHETSAKYFCSLWLQQAYGRVEQSLLGHFHF